MVAGGRDGEFLLQLEEDGLAGVPTNGHEKDLPARLVFWVFRKVRTIHDEDLITEAEDPLGPALLVDVGELPEESSFPAFVLGAPEQPCHRLAVIPQVACLQQGPALVERDVQEKVLFQQDVLERQFTVNHSCECFTRTLSRCHSCRDGPGSHLCPLRVLDRM